MEASQLVFLLIVFVVVSAIALLGMMAFSSGPLRQRLSTFMTASAGAAATEADAPGGAWIEKVAKVARPFTRLSLPEEGWERSPLRTRFMNAGWRHPAAPALYFAAKTVLVMLLPGLLVLSMVALQRLPDRNIMLFLVLAGAALGYYLPNLALDYLVKRRQREILENFPDALDLLTVCVEAGLSLERGLVKVATEIHIKSVILAQELQLVLMEMRAGFSKEQALRNLALRSGVEDIDTLVAMLIQSERFGTSMGDSLRVHSDNLRLKRSQQAEEAAAKIALKLLFPLIFCVFPTLLLVLMGPAAIQIQKVMLPSMAGAH